MHNKDPFLKPRDYVNAVKQQPEYIEAHAGDAPTSPESLIKRHKLAISLGAHAAAEVMRQEHGKFDIKPRIMDMVSRMDDFYDSRQRIATHKAELRKDRISDEAYQDFIQAKETVIDFNHTLREVIEVNNNRFNFEDLLVFMTEIHAAINGPDTQQEFYDHGQEVLIGMRNEIATEQILLQYSDYEFELGDEADDAIGADLIIEGVPFDVKSSPKSTERAQKTALRYGRNPHLVIWSHLKPEDFKGRLTLPAEASKKAAPELIRDVRTGLAAHRMQRSA